VTTKFELEIEEAEEKVHFMQKQASIIKSNAQFKIVTNLEKMNNACSHKLLVKEKTEKDIYRNFVSISDN
jgi:DNA-directed RNA polymerase subunit RPC12/RpoP